MLDIVLSNQFKKDLKLMSRRGVNLELLERVVNKLANNEELANTRNYAMRRAVSHPQL